MVQDKELPEGSSPESPGRDFQGAASGRRARARRSLGHVGVHHGAGRDTADCSIGFLVLTGIRDLRRQDCRGVLSRGGAFRHDFCWRVLSGGGARSEARARRSQAALKEKKLVTNQLGAGEVENQESGEGGSYLGAGPRRPHGGAATVGRAPGTRRIRPWALLPGVPSLLPWAVASLCIEAGASVGERATVTETKGLGLQRSVKERVS